MKIVHLMASPFYGGPERQILGLARHLPAECETNFLTFAEGGKSQALVAEVRAAGFEIDVLAHNFPHVGRCVSEIAGRLRELRADVLVTSGYKPDILGWRAARLVGIPIVVVSHGWTGATWKVRVYERLDRWVHARAEAVVSVSEGQAAKVRAAGVRDERNHVIPNAIGDDAFAAPNPADRGALVGMFAHQPSRIVGAAGRLSPEKGFDVLIDAAAELCAKRSDVGVVIFGDGPLRGDLERRIAKHGLDGRVILAGYRRDVARFVPHFDVGVLPSFTEGLPVTLLEMAAAGIAIVGSRVGGIPEVLVDGGTGLLVTPGRPTELADGIRRLLGDATLRRRLGDAVRERVRSHHSFAGSGSAAYRIAVRFAGPRSGDAGGGRVVSVLVVVFWICFAIVGGTYVGYPLLVGVWARLFGRSATRGEFAGSFTVLLAAHNEENNIERRLAELRRQIAATGLDGELIVVADGCTDRTAERAEARRALPPRPPALTGEQGRGEGGQYPPRHLSSRRLRCPPSGPLPPQSRGRGERFDVRVLTSPENRGKAAALTRGAGEATGDILVFADVRQTWADDAIVRMLANFADPAVGAVSGDLVLESEPGVLAGVGLYWRFEKWLRREESRSWSQVGVTGAIAAGRRELFEPIPDGTVLDDVCWPLRIAMRGYRVIHDESARAFDRLPEKPVAEFRRKVRTLAGNLQLAGRIPTSLLPWRNRVWTAWIGHKLARLVVPWALIGLFVTSMLIDSPWAQGFAVVQAGCYGLALAGLTPWLRRSRLAGAAASFLVLNAAAACAWWVWLTGRTAGSWRKVDYRRTVLCPTNEVSSRDDDWLAFGLRSLPSSPGSAPSSTSRSRFAGRTCRGGCSRISATCGRSRGRGRERRSMS